MESAQDCPWRINLGCKDCRFLATRTQQNEDRLVCKEDCPLRKRVGFWPAKRWDISRNTASHLWRWSCHFPRHQPLLRGACPNSQISLEPQKNSVWHRWHSYIWHFPGKFLRFQQDTHPHFHPDCTQYSLETLFFWSCVMVHLCGIGGTVEVAIGEWEALSGCCSKMIFPSGVKQGIVPCWKNHTSNHGRHGSAPCSSRMNLYKADKLSSFSQFTRSMLAN